MKCTVGVYLQHRYIKNLTLAKPTNYFKDVTFQSIQICREDESYFTSLVVENIIRCVCVVVAVVLMSEYGS